MVSQQDSKINNKLLAITRNCIPYVAELRPIAGSVTASILWQQLDYWFSRMGEVFYKFLEPAEKHPAYKTGDSWVEELGFSKDEFRSAFDKIGTRYPSKSAFEKEINPFRDKYFLSFHNKIKGLTYYLRNNDLADSALDSILTNRSFTPVNRESQSTDIGNTYPGKLKVPIQNIDTEITSDTTATTLETDAVVIVNRILSKLPRELQLDDQVQAIVATTLQAKGEEYVISNIQTTLEQAKSSKKGFLVKALKIDFGHLQRARNKVFTEKVAQLAEEKKEREANHMEREAGQSPSYEEYKRWVELNTRNSLRQTSDDRRKE